MCLLAGKQEYIYASEISVLKMKISKNMKAVDKFIDFRYKGKIYNAKLFYKGYFSRLYKFSDGKKEYLVKFYVDNKHSNNISGVSVREMLEREIEGFKRIESVKNMAKYGVTSPKIFEVNYEKNYYIMEFIECDSFNKFLMKNSNLFFYNEKMDDLVLNFGKFLAKFHNKNRIDKDLCHQHGDLNYKNIGFSGNNVVLLDPSHYSYKIKNKIHLIYKANLLKP